MSINDSLEMVFCHLSQRVEDVIPDLTYPQNLDRLLELLAEWENPPTVLAQTAYRWCFVISGKLGRLDQGRIALENRVYSHRPHLSHPQDETADKYATLLLTALKIGSRQSEQGGFSFLRTPHCEWMFEVLFSSGDDEVIADAVCARVVDPRGKTIGLCRTIVRAIVYISSWGPEVTGLELETARLLNCLDDPCVDEMKYGIL